VRLRSSSILLRGASLLFVILAVILAIFQLVRYSLLRADYPPDMTIAGVSVGGTDPQTAQQRLLQVYTTPIELHYGQAVIDLAPNLIGFQLNTESMLAAADLQRTGSSFWGGFWDYLWNRRSMASQIPLVSTFSEQRLRDYLRDEVSSRYDQPAIPAEPIPGSANYKPGTPGQILDIDRAVSLIENAMQSPTDRKVILSSQQATPGRPSLQQLEAQLKSIIAANGFDGLVDLYFLDLQSAQELHFATQAGQDVPLSPEISFGASSTIKIPIMVTTYVHYGSTLDSATSGLLQNMISLSDNTAADSLMQGIDQVRGPLVVSETMKKLGLNNTFLAGYFFPGAPVLELFNTPANSRTDINTNPDVYNQTTPADMGMLLEDIYQCSKTGGGALVAAFPGQINQAACEQIIQTLELDKVGALLQTGVPDGTAIAHKHGWVTDLTGVMHTVCDSAIVYTPGGNYVLTVYTYHPVQIIWEDPATHLGINHMYADISRAVYNYFNLPTP
jgi:beta-lactamase class A